MNILTHLMEKLGYLEETKRLYGVLEIHLKDRDYLAGPGRGIYSIADINCFPWLNSHKSSGIVSLDQWPSVKVSSLVVLAAVERPHSGIDVGRAHLFSPSGSGRYRHPCAPGSKSLRISWDRWCRLGRSTLHLNERNSLNPGMNRVSLNPRAYSQPVRRTLTQGFNDPEGTSKFSHS